MLWLDPFHYMTVTRSELDSFVPFARSLQRHYWRHRATHLSAWRLRFHFIQELEAHKNIVRTMNTPTISFLSDPFEEDYNPGTADGTKLFVSAIKDWTEENLLTIAQSKVNDIMATFRHDSNMFC